MSDRKTHSESQKALRNLIAEVEKLLTPTAKVTLWGLEQLKERALNHLDDPYRPQVEALAFQPQKGKVTGSGPVTDGATFIIPPGWTSNQFNQYIENELHRFLLILRDVAERQSTGTALAVVQDEFTHSPDFRSVTIRGLNFLLSPAQASIIEVLDKAWADGHSDLGLHYVIEHIEHTASRIQDLFKSNQAAYKELIASKRRGTVRLNLRDPE